MDSYYYSYDSDFFGFLSGMGIGAYLLLLVLGLLIFIAWCRLIHRAGRAWPLIFIPIYGTYLQYSIAGCGGIFWGTVGLSLLAFLLSSVVENVGTLLVISIFLGIILFVMQIVYFKRLAAAFGRKAGFVVGLLLLFPIFFLILGFSDSEYVGA